MNRGPVYILTALAVALLLSSCHRNKRTTKSKPTSRKEHTSTSSNTHRGAEYKLRAKYASTLGVQEGDIRNVSLYQFIDEWTGTPYRYGGTSKSGTDCSGFVGSLYRDVYGKSIPRTTGEISKKANKVSTSSLREGDIVFFDINGKKSSHIGVYLQNQHFVHASSSKGVIISDLQNPYYKKAFSHGGRL